MRPATLALCLLAASWFPCALMAPTALAQDAIDKLPLLPERDQLASVARQVSREMRAVFLDVSAAPARGVLPRDQTVRNLRSGLTRLELLDARRFRGLGTKLGELAVRERLVRDRALAFVHAWAAVSLLTDEAGRVPTPPTWRDGLLALGTAGDRSALDLLLEIFRQIREAQPGEADPLRTLLGSQDLAYDLAYRQTWRNGEDRGSVAHGHYIPSATDLVGAPGDPTVPDRQLLSLWALVNTQLDREHDFTTRRQHRGAPGAIWTPWQTGSAASENTMPCRRSSPTWRANPR